MTTQEIANRYYALAQEGRYSEILQEMYHPDTESNEPQGAFLPNAKGMDQLLAKAENFNSMVEEMHGGYCNEPQVYGNYFSCTMGMDLTMKGQGRMQMDELCVFKVEDGKITEENFFY